MNRQDRKARQDRMDAITAGLMVEVAAFNAAVRAGADVRLPKRNDGSLCLGQRVASARYGFDGLWIECANYGGSFAYGNDGRWADLLAQAGIPRDPRTT